MRKMLWMRSKLGRSSAPTSKSSTTGSEECLIALSVRCFQMSLLQVSSKSLLLAKYGKKSKEASTEMEGSYSYTLQVETGKLPTIHSAVPRLEWKEGIVRCNGRCRSTASEERTNRPFHIQDTYPVRSGRSLYSECWDSGSTETQRG